MIVKGIRYLKKDINKYPFNIDLIKNFEELILDKPITFIVGENASGKSTLIEGIACSLELPTVGKESVRYDKTLVEARKLAKQLRIDKRSKGGHGFFMRSDDFINFCRRQRETVVELNADLNELEKEFEGKSDYAKMLMRGPLVSSINQLENRYDGYLDTLSHGESFLTLFKSRLVPNGIYILDEPEVALSPQNQYSLMALIIDSIKEGSQFIIATHSPIIQALPYSNIFEVSDGFLKKMDYEDLENVKFYKSFLENHERYVAYLEE